MKQNNLGKIDVGMHDGKRLVAKYLNVDGTLDFQTEDGVVYKDVKLKKHENPITHIMETEYLLIDTVPFEYPNLKLDKK